MSKWTFEWTGFQPKVFWFKLGDKYYGFGKPESPQKGVSR